MKDKKINEIKRRKKKIKGKNNLKKEKNRRKKI